MNVVELDVRNLRRWLTGAIGTTGANTESSSPNGYILFFSDRRGMLPNGGGQKVGEYGYEDIINLSDSAGNPNGVLDSAEDVNQNGVLDVYGGQTSGTDSSPQLKVATMPVTTPKPVSAPRPLHVRTGSVGPATASNW